MIFSEQSGRIKGKEVASGRICRGINPKRVRLTRSLIQTCSPVPTKDREEPGGGGIGVKSHGTRSAQGENRSARDIEKNIISNLRNILREGDRIASRSGEGIRGKNHCVADGQKVGRSGRRVIHQQRGGCTAPQRERGRSSRTDHCGNAGCGCSGIQRDGTPASRLKDR